MVLGNLACTTHGACIVVPAPSFEPTATLSAVQDERCTGFSSGRLTLPPAVTRRAQPPAARRAPTRLSAPAMAGALRVVEVWSAPGQRPDRDYRPAI